MIYMPRLQYLDPAVFADHQNAAGVFAKQIIHCLFIFCDSILPDKCLNGSGKTAAMDAADTAVSENCLADCKGQRRILEQMVSRSGLDLPKLPEGVEYHVREAGGERYIFLLNLEEKEKQIDGIHGTDLLTQKICDGTVKLEPYGVMAVKVKQG